LKAAVVGTGSWGKHHLRVLNDLGHLDSFVEMDNERRIFYEKKYSIKGFSNINDLVNDHDVDIVNICTPTITHFEIAKMIIAAKLVPIIEPEVDIHCETKAEAETMLLKHLMDHIEQLASDQKVILKLTIPNENNLFTPCINHPNVIRVFALSGGYSRDEANSRLSLNKGMVASFNRALTEGLSAQQTDEEFNLMLDSSIESIYQASIT